MITELDAVKSMLAGLGELPASSLDDGHPLVPPARLSLSVSNTREQSKGWWFNTERVRIIPDTEGYIYVPADCLRVDPVCQGHNFVQRGRRLYKPSDPTIANKYTFTEEVDCTMIREVPFEDLPAMAQQVVSLSAQLEFMKNYDADANKIKFVSQLYTTALITLNAEHTRNVGANILRSRVSSSRVIREVR